VHLITRSGKVVSERTRGDSGWFMKCRCAAFGLLESCYGGRSDCEIYNAAFRIWRPRRVRWFLERIRPEVHQTMLDLGGTRGAWEKGPVRIARIDLLNSDTRLEGTMVGDACALPFADGSYDIVAAPTKKRLSACFCSPLASVKLAIWSNWTVCTTVLARRPERPDNTNPRIRICRSFMMVKVEEGERASDPTAKPMEGGRGGLTRPRGVSRTPRKPAGIVPELPGAACLAK